MDDLLVRSEGPTEYLEISGGSLSEDVAGGLQINPEKAQMYQREVCYLGYNVSQGQISLRRYVEGLPPATAGIVSKGDLEISRDYESLPPLLSELG